MKSTLNPSALYWATFNTFVLRLPGEAVLDIAQSGDNAPAVEFWAPKVRAQAEADAFANAPTPDRIREELKEYGAWSPEELADDAKNWNRIVWTAAWNIAEEDEPDCSAPTPPGPQPFPAAHTMEGAFLRSFLELNRLATVGRRGDVPEGEGSTP